MAVKFIRGFKIDPDRILKLDNDHYDITPLDAHNKSFNIILTGLASGKTTRVKKKIFDAFLNKGHKFLWVVRHVKEMEGKFLTEFMNQFEGYNFYIDAGRLCAREVDTTEPDTINEKGETIKGKTIRGNERVVGYFVALTSTDSFKKLQIDGVHYIVFDEFILDPYVAHNNYIPGEVKNLLILWDKMGRNTNFKTKLYLLGNPIEIANPIFANLSIDPIQVRKHFNKVYIPHEDIAVHYCDTPSVIRRQRENTPYARVARLLPEYYEMAINSAEEYAKKVVYLKHVPDNFRPFACFKTNYGVIYIYTGFTEVENKKIFVYITNKPFTTDKPMYTFDSKNWNGSDTTLVDQFVSEKKVIKMILSRMRKNEFAAANEDVYMGMRDIIGFLK